MAAVQRRPRGGGAAQPSWPPGRRFCPSALTQARHRGLPGWRDPAPPQFRPPRVLRRPFFDAQLIDLSRELGAELLEQRRIHQVRPKPAQHRRLERIPPDVEPVVAGTLVPRGRAAEQVLRDQGVAAAADAALGQPGEQMLRPPPIEQRVRACLVLGANASARCRSFTASQSA